MQRITPERLQEPALHHTRRGVKPEEPGRNLADHRERFNDGAAKAKVISPIVLSVIKEAHELSGPMARRDVAALVAIADHAAIGKITAFGRSAVLSTYNVIHFMRKTGAVFRNQAILALLSRARDDHAALGGAWLFTHARGSGAREP